MRNLGFVMIMGFVFLLGCENKQLIQCQQDLEETQEKLEKAQSDYAAEKKTSGQILSRLMLQKQEEVKNLRKQTEQARLDEKSKHETALKNASSKQAELTQTILQLQGTVSQLQTKQNEVLLKLAEAQKQAKEKEKKIKNSGEMLRALAAENSKLKVENKKLKAMIEELQKKLEDEKGGDSGNIE